MKTIEIDLEVFKVIQANLLAFDESCNSVLRRLLEIDNPKVVKLDLKKQDIFYYKEVPFVVGLELRGKHKNRIYKAIVGKDGFIYNGKSWPSLSSCAHAVTNTSRNGWTFWKAYSESDNEWFEVSEYRD